MKVQKNPGIQNEYRDNPYGGEGGICIFAFGKNYGSAPSSRRRQQSTGLLYLYRFKSREKVKKNTTRLGGVFWRRRRDLNPRYPFGVYTISNRARSASYATSPYAVVSLDILQQKTKFVNPYFPVFCKGGFRNSPVFATWIWYHRS